MLTLKAEKRNPDEKAKKLRRDGFITGVLYGKEMKENVSLKFTEKDASAFIKNAKEGTQAYLELDGYEYCMPGSGGSTGAGDLDRFCGGQRNPGTEENHQRRAGLR